MNRSLLILIISLFAVLLLVITNPSEAEHQSAVKRKVTAYMNSIVEERHLEDNKTVTGLMATLGGYMADKVVNESVSRSNYLLLSTTKFIYKGEKKTIGIGILGNVFLSSKVDQVLNKDGSLNELGR